MVDFNVDIPIAKSIVDSISKGLDERTLSPEESLEYELKNRRVDADVMLGQMAVNRQEAAHADYRVAGWRPRIGFICGDALWISTVGYFYFYCTWSVVNSIWDIGDVPASPLDMTTVTAILVPLLGVVGMRSWDKHTGKDTKKLAAPELPDIRIVDKIMDATRFKKKKR